MKYNDGMGQQDAAIDPEPDEINDDDTTFICYTED